MKKTLFLIIALLLFMMVFASCGKEGSFQESSKSKENKNTQDVPLEESVEKDGVYYLLSEDKAYYSASCVDTTSESIYGYW